MILRSTLDLLADLYDPVRAEFPAQIRMSARGYDATYGGPNAARYSINCLLGLQEAKRHGLTHPSLRETDELILAFVDRHRGSIRRLSDLGLLTALTASHPRLRDYTTKAIAVADRACSSRRSALLTMQDLGWLLWGSVSAAQAGTPGADALTHALISRLASKYVVEETSLPRHSLNPLRAGIVSFGSIAYFLKAVHDYWAWCGSRDGWELFVRGVDAALRLQQPDGAWPWLASATTGNVLSRYPIFSVHQLSMAMFFLLPARRGGIIESEAPIAGSVAWVNGVNELRRPLASTDPVFVFRSIGPRTLWPRAERYLSALRRTLLRRELAPASNRRLVIDTTSHGYEWGWLLQAWSAPKDRQLLARLWPTAVT